MKVTLVNGKIKKKKKKKKIHHVYKIVSNISNSSKFSQPTLNKIIVTRKTIEESGAVDLIDILKSISDVNITQSGPKGQQASVFMREQDQIIL